MSKKNSILEAEKRTAAQSNYLRDRANNLIQKGQSLGKQSIGITKPSSGSSLQNTTIDKILRIQNADELEEKRKKEAAAKNERARDKLGYNYAAFMPRSIDFLLNGYTGGQKNQNNILNSPQKYADDAANKRKLGLDANGDYWRMSDQQLADLKTDYETKIGGWTSIVDQFEKSQKKENKEEKKAPAQSIKNQLVKERLDSGWTPKITTRDDQYNDFAELYDRMLYDDYYGKGAYDREFNSTNRDVRENAYAKLRELWADVDSGAVEETINAKKAPAGSTDEKPLQIRSAKIREQLDLGHTPKITYRDDQYNDFGEHYDKLLYDEYYGQGAYDREFNSTNRITRENAYANLRELWADVDSGVLEPIAAGNKERHKILEQYDEALEGIKDARKQLEEITNVQDTYARIAQLEQGAPEGTGVYDPTKRQNNIFTTPDSVDQVYVYANMDLTEADLNDFQRLGKLQEAQFMSTEQKKIFNNYYNSGDKEAAQAYYDALKSTGALDAMRSQYRQELETRMMEDPLYSGIMRFNRAATKPVDALAGTAMTVMSLFGNKAVRNTDSELWDLVRTNNTIQQASAQQTGKLFRKIFGDTDLAQQAGEFLDGVVWSMVDNLVARGIGMGIGAATGAGQTAEVAGSIIQWIMSTEAVSNKMYDSLSKKMDPTEAVLRAAGQGMIEWITENWSTDRFFENYGNGSLFRQTIAGMVPEAQEEAAGHVAETILDEALSRIFDHESEIKESVRKYKEEENLSEKDAFARALADWGLDLGKSALAGGLSGAGMGFAGGVQARVTNYQTNKAAGQTAANYNIAENATEAERTTGQAINRISLIEMARKMPEGSESRKLGEELYQKMQGKKTTTGEGQGTTQGGKRVTDAEYGQLVRAILADTNESVHDTVKRVLGMEIEQRLRSAGEEETRIRSLANSLVNMIAGTYTEADMFNVMANKNTAVMLSEYKMGETKKAAEAKAQTAEMESIRESVEAMVTPKPELSVEKVTEVTKDAPVASEEEIRQAGGKKNAGPRSAVTNGMMKEIAGVETVQNADGKGTHLQVKFTDGTTADIADVKATDQQTARVLEFARQNKNKTTSDNFTNILLQHMDGATDAAKMISGATRIRWDVLLGKKTTNSGLDAETVNELRDAAAADMEEAEKRRVANFRQINPGKGRTMFRGVAYGTNGFAAALKGLSRVQRAEAVAIGAIAKSAGFDVELINDPQHTAEQGSYSARGGIVINLAGKQRNDMHRSAIATFAHEITHWIEGNSPQAYKELRMFVMNMQENSGLNLEQRLGNIMDSYAKEGVELDMYDAVAELVAKSSEEVLTDEKVIDQLQGEYPNLFSRIRDAVGNVVERIRGALGTAKETSSVYAQTIREYAGKLSNLWLKGYEEAKNRTGETTEEAEKAQASLQEEGGYDYLKGYEEQIDDVINNNDISNEPVFVGEIPQTFKKLGMEKLPLVIAKGHINEMLGKSNRVDKNHVFDEYFVKHLPETISHPVAIIESRSAIKSGNSIVLILDQHNPNTGHNTIAALELQKEYELNGEHYDGYMLTSVHGRENAVNLLTNALDTEDADNHGVFYFNKKKAIALSKSSNVNAAKAGRIKAFAKHGFIHSINDQNSTVKAATKNQTDTVQFARWFNNSKIVNDDGTPKIMYHGTLHGGFDEFGGRNDFWYFTDSKDYAKVFSGRKRNNQFAKGIRDGVKNGTYKPQIYEVYLSVQNPYVTDDQDIIETALYWDRSLAQELRNKGYDALMMKDMSQVIVLNKNQIKSATDNIGTFDEGQNNIKYSVQEDESYMQAVENGDWRAAEQMLLEKAQNTQGITGYKAAHFYGGEHKDVAKMIKENYGDAVAKAVEEMAPMIPDNAVLIPMPPHEGKVLESTDTMILARALSEATGMPVIKALESDYHPSRYQAKASGDRSVTADTMGFRQAAEIPEGSMPVFIDNMVGGGQTAMAAKNAIGRGITLAYAQSARGKSQGVKALTVTYDKDGKLIPLSQRMDPENKSWKYSVQEDESYMQDVNSGNMEAAQNAVDKAASAHGYTIRAFHGTGRADRVGTVFLPERATSGPMAFFTDSRDIAENYAKDKQDTSIAYDEEYGDYYNQFRIIIRGKNVPVGKLWNTLSFAERQKITEAAKHITLDDEAEEIIYDKDTQYGVGNFSDYERKLHGWNSIDTLIDGWLESGTLWNREGDFLKVLELAGIKGATWNNPDARVEKVYDTYLNIQKPFVVNDMYNEEFLNRLQKWWKKQDHSKYERESMGADFWDKNSITVDEWIEDARRDIENGTTHQWTRIPDGVTAYLQSEGYDGIKDQGGKGGGAGHTVWIPFSSEQIKSAEPVTYDDKGNIIPPSERFDPQKKDIRWSLDDENEGEIRYWLMSVKPESLQTEAERQLLANYKNLQMRVDLRRRQEYELKDKISALEKKGALEKGEKNLLAKWKIQLQNAQNIKQQAEEELGRIVGTEGYARLMRQQARRFEDFQYGKTQAEVNEEVTNLQKSAEKLNELIEENRKRAEEIESRGMIGQLKKILGTTTADQTAAELKKEFHSSWTKTQIRNYLDPILIKLAAGEDISSDVEELAGILVESDERNTYEALAGLRGLTITLGKGAQKELKAQNSSLKEIRSRLAGTGITVKYGDRSTLEADIENLREQYPGMPEFGSDKDALENFVSWVEGMKRSGAEEYYDERLAEAMAQIMGKVAATAQGIYIPTEAKAQKQILALIDFVKGLNAETQDAVNTLQKIADQATEIWKGSGRAAGLANVLTTNISEALEYYDKTAKMAIATAKKERNNQIIEQLKSKHAQEIAKRNEEWRELIERDRDARRTAEDIRATRSRINTSLKRLYNLLKNPKGLNNIPEFMQGTARELLGIFVNNDLDEYRKAKLTLADRGQLEEAKRLLTEWEKQDGPFRPEELDAAEDNWVRMFVLQDLTDIRDGIDDLNREYRGKNRLDTLQHRAEILQKIQEAASEIYSAIRAEGKVQMRDRQIAVEDAAYNVAQGTQGRQYKEFTGKAGNTLRLMQRAIVTGNMTPEYYFRMLGNAGLSELWDNYHAAENRNGLELKKAQARLAEIAEKYGYRNWDLKQKITLKLESGDVEVTLGQLMSLWATWKRENTLGPAMSEHLTKGGFYAEQDTRDGFLGRKVLERKAHRIRVQTDESGAITGSRDMALVESLLSDEQLKFIDDVVSYMSNEMSQLGNEASMAAYGIKLYKEKYYFPFQMWDGVKSRKSNEAGGAAAARERGFHPSFSKSRLHGANNAIVIGDFMQTAADHIAGMINYATMGLADNTLEKVLNQQTSDEDGTKRNVRTMLQEAYGAEAARYLNELQEQLNGGAVKVEKTFYDKLISLFRKNAVAGSLSVALQQPLSYIRAATMISPKYLARALSPDMWKGSYAEMQAHSGAAVIKDMGRFDMNFGQSAREFLQPDAQEKAAARIWHGIEEYSTKLPELMDRMTWTRMWSAVKAEQAAQHPEMDTKSDEFLDMVGERFNDIMRRTQVYDSVLVRSANMRSQNPAVKSLTSFMAEPTLTLNVLADSVRMAKNGEKGGIEMAAKAGATFILSAIMQAAVKGLMGSGRTPDEKKTWEENFLYRFEYNFLNEADPLQLVPGFSDMVTVLKGGELKDDAYGTLKKMLDAYGKLGEIFTGGGYRAVEDSVGQLAQLYTGLPMKNLMRDARAMWNWFVDHPYAERETSGAVIKGQRKDLFFNADNLVGVVNNWLGEAGYKTTNKGYYQQIYQAKKAGDTQRAEDMIEYLLKGKGVKQTAIDSGIAGAAKADDSISAAEKADFLIGEGSESADDYIRKQLREGEMTAAEARTALQKAQPKKSKDDVWWQVDRIEYQLKTGTEKAPSGYYYRLTDAIDSNKTADIRAAVKELTDHGITKDKIKGKLSEWKSAYLAAKGNEKVRIKNALIIAYKAIGISETEANKIINKWK